MERPPSPEQLRYEEALRLGVEENKIFNKLPWESGGAQYEKVLDASLAQRALLLRKMGIRNIGDTPLPPVDPKDPEIIDLFGDEIMKHKQGTPYSPRLQELSDKVGAMSPEQRKEFTSQRMKRFTEVRKELGEELGFEVVHSRGNFISFKKGDLIIEVKSFTGENVDKSWRGIGQSKRISKMWARRSVEGKAEEGELMDYQHGWGIACEDPEVQKEVDKVVAALG